MKRVLGDPRSAGWRLGALSTMFVCLALEPGRASLVARGSTDCFETPDQPRGPGTVDVLIELTEAPLASRVAGKPAAGDAPADSALARQATTAQARRIRDQQDRFIAILRRPPFRAVEIYRVRRALNAVAVRVDPARLAEIRKLADVKSVRPLDQDRPHARDVPPHS